MEGVKVEDMLDIIYSKVMQEAVDFSEISKEMEFIIQHKAEDLKADKEQKREIREMMYDFLGIVQEAYFKLGFKYGIQFMKEVN